MAEKSKLLQALEKNPIQSQSTKRLSDDVVSIINKHIKLEFDSSQIYVDMGAWCDAKALFNTAKFFREHADEERKHMHKLYDYLITKGCKPTTPSSDAPKSDYNSLKDLLQKAYDHEVEITTGYEVDAKSIFEKDLTTFGLFQWYISEQCEEEDVYLNMLDKINMLGNEGCALELFDQWMEK